MTFKSKIRTWKKLTVQHEGRTLVGSFAYSRTDQSVEVRNMKGHRKAGSLGGSTPDTLARALLIELADEGMT